MPTPGPVAGIDADEAASLLDPLMARSAGAGAVLLAVSGGPDSMALLHLAARWRADDPQARPPLFAATVDHGLRAGSAQEAGQAAEWCARLGVEHQILAWTGDKPETGIHEAAREARYRLLADCARRLGATHLATAHHQDDQAETVLMRLTRGSGLAGLAGMASSRRLGEVLHVRPFLGVPKARLVATLAAAGQDFFTDPSNADPRFGRARIRKIMEALGPEGLDAPRLAALARRAARADAALDHAAELVFARFADETTGGVTLRPGWWDEPEEIALRVMVRALDPAGLVRLERAERLMAALAGAVRAGQPLRRSLAGRVLALDGHGHVTISREKDRRRGRPPKP